MKMIINVSKKALEQLRIAGEVVTFRLKEMKVLGDDWVTDRRGGKKLYDVFVDIEEANIIPADLGGYVENSGFKSLKEWINEIKQIHKCDEQTKGFLYYVCLQRKEEENEKR